MIIGLELLIEYSYSIPELRVLDVLKGVKGMLVGVEALLEVFNQEIAVTQSCPGRPIVRVNGG